jgi:hypothetical protein
MTPRQALIKQRQEAKQLMIIHRPNKDAMGNMYHYWEDKWNEARRKLEQLKNKR